MQDNMSLNQNPGDDATDKWCWWCRGELEDSTTTTTFIRSFHCLLFIWGWAAAWKRFSLARLDTILSRRRCFVFSLLHAICHAVKDNYYNYYLTLCNLLIVVAIYSDVAYCVVFILLLSAQDVSVFVFVIENCWEQLQIFVVVVVFIVTNACVLLSLVAALVYFYTISFILLGPNC